MKYIIKNCPSCRNHNVFGLEEEGCCYQFMDYCKNHPDCLLKLLYTQIKEVATLDDINCVISPETMQLSKDVLNTLKLLDIQEIEE